MVALTPCVMVDTDQHLPQKDSITVVDMRDDPMILLDLPLSREYFLSVFHAAGIRPNIAQRTSDLSVARSLVANGCGYCLINFRTKTRIAPDGEELNFLKLSGNHRPMVLGLATKRSEHVPRVISAFTEHVQKLAEKGTLPGMAPL